MILNISQALHFPGRSMEFAFEEDWPSMELNGDPVEFIGPIIVSGNCVYTSEDFIVRGSLKVKYRIMCARCTAEFETGLEAEFSEEFSRERIEDHPDRYVFEGDTISLDKMLADNIHLQAPTRHICRPDCKGLCLICGADKNVSDCGCEDKIDDNNPFNVLSDLFKDEEV